MKLEAENTTLKTNQHQSRTSLNRRIGPTIEDTVKISSLEQQIENLEQQLKSCRENSATERQATKQAQLNLWKKEKELSDANLDKRIATREAKTADEKLKSLQEEKQKLSERLNTRIREEEEKARKMLKDLDIAKHSLADATKEVTRNKLQADSAQKVKCLVFLSATILPLR
jgi:citron Rho-interacting kinase